MPTRLLLVAIWLLAVWVAPAGAQEAEGGSAPPVASEATPAATPESQLTPSPEATPGDRDPTPVAPSEGATTTPPPASPSPEPTERARRAVRPAASSVGVSAVDDAFRPMELTVTVGTEVVWTNAGQNPHTVTADDRAFDSGTLEPGQTFSVVFEEAGRVPYYCQIHGEPGSGMFGVVIVRPAPAAEEGTPPPPPSPEGPLARTGAGPVPFGLSALALLAVGALTLRLGARRIRTADRSMDTEGRRRG